MRRKEKHGKLSCHYLFCSFVIRLPSRQWSSITITLQIIPFWTKKRGLLNCSLPYLKTNTSSIAAQLLLVKGKDHFDVSIEWDNCREMEEIKKIGPGVGYSYPSGIIHRYALESWVNALKINSAYFLTLFSTVWTSVLLECEVHLWRPPCITYLEFEEGRNIRIRDHI